MRHNQRISSIPASPRSNGGQQLWGPLMPKNLSHLPEKRPRDPENLEPIKRPEKRLKTQDSSHRTPSKHVKQAKRPRDEDTRVSSSPEESPDRARKSNDRLQPSREDVRSSDPYPRKLNDEDTTDPRQNYISYWAQKKRWPRSYFTDGGMHPLLARKGSASSLSRKRSNSSQNTGDDKSAPYRNPNYSTFLSEGIADYKSYLEDHKLGISSASKELLEKLLNTEHTHPKESLFRDDLFRTHFQKLKGKNEARVVQDISPLLVPSAEALSTFGAQHLDGIVESVNEGWNNCFPITKSRPQPDSAFGCGTSAFSEDQLDKLRPWIGNASFSSLFKATYYMYFPFLTKEVKTGTMGLDIADNQNAHSATIAVRAVVELLRHVGREKDIHREIVAFSVSHDDKSVRLYGHYPYVDGDKVTIWRHTIDQFYIDTKTKWRSRNFTINIFDIFYPIHLKDRICPAIDKIKQNSSRPSNTSSGSTQGLEDHSLTSGTSGLSQNLEHQHLNNDLEIPDSQPSSQQITPNTSIHTEPRSPQRKKTKER